MIKTTINERVKLVRNSLNLTQKEFGQKITLAQTYLSQIEKGDRDVTEKIQKLICLQFNVNEGWLCTGTGEMFVRDEDADIAKLAREFSLDKLGQAIIKSYSHLNDFEKSVIGNYVKSVAKEYEKVEDSQSNETKSESNRITDEIDPDIKQELDSYRQELEMEKSIRTSSASPHSGENVS